MSFHRIAYEALDVCNGVEMTTLEAAVARTGIAPGGRALDIGTGNAAVAIRLAERFGLKVEAVEFDPAMATLARSRIEASGASEAISLHEARSDAVLAAEPDFDLIVALGVTEPVGEGIRDPRAMFEGLAQHLTPGGHLLWGDLVWLSEPAPPLRQIVEMTNTYANHDGWQAAAREAGLEVASAEICSAEAWQTYRATMAGSVADWLAAHPDHADAAAIRTRAAQIEMMLDFGEGVLGFGLYLFRNEKAAPLR